MQRLRHSISLCMRRIREWKLELCVLYVYGFIHWICIYSLVCERVYISMMMMCVHRSNGRCKCVYAVVVVLTCLFFHSESFNMNILPIFVDADLTTSDTTACVRAWVLASTCRCMCELHDVVFTFLAKISRLTLNVIWTIDVTYTHTHPKCLQWN